MIVFSPCLVKILILPLPKTMTSIFVPSVTLVWTDLSKIEKKSMFHVM
jgi:hypothetical protein